MIIGKFSQVSNVTRVFAATLTGELNVLRYDSGHLIDIKQGKYTLEEIKNMANNLFPLVDRAYVHSDLPAKPDKERAEKLLMEIAVNSIEWSIASMRDIWERKGSN